MTTGHCIRACVPADCSVVKRSHEMFFEKKKIMAPILAYDSRFDRPTHTHTAIDFIDYYYLSIQFNHICDFRHRSYA